MDRLSQAEANVWQAFKSNQITFTEVLIAISNIEYYRALERTRKESQ